MSKASRRGEPSRCRGGRDQGRRASKGERTKTGREAREVKKARSGGKIFLLAGDTSNVLRSVQVIESLFLWPKTSGARRGQ